MMCVLARLILLGQLLNFYIFVPSKMSRILFLLVLYCSLSVAVGRHVRVFYFQVFADTSLSVKTFFFNLKYGEAESNETEESDSEDSEKDSFEDNDDHELTQSNFHRIAFDSRPGHYSTPIFLKDHHQEIGTPPPRF